MAILARVKDLGLNELRVFVRVVDRGAFAAAARDLRVPTSTVSRTIARLEARVGARLLQRTTRSVSVTSEGRALYATVHEALGVLERAAHTLEPATRTPKGTLRVTAPAEIACTFLADVLTAFGERYPQLRVELMVTNRNVNLVDEGYDVAVRAAARLADSSLVAKKLGDIEHALYAAPRYLEAHGVPSSPGELASHRCLVFRANDLQRTWTVCDDTQTIELPVQGWMGADDFSYVRAAVIAGGGIALLPRLGCAKAEAAGQLVRVLPAFAAQGAGLYVLCPSAAHVPARVSAFRSFIAEAFEAWRVRGTPRKKEKGARTRSPAS
jgi:DNA-binding transcriptional LysR family regulator